MIGQKIAISDKELINTTNQSYKILFEHFTKNKQ